MSTAEAAVAASSATPESRHEFPFIVDGKEYVSHQCYLTGAEIMQRAGIPAEAGLIEIAQDGTQYPVPADKVVDLKEPHCFRHPPRFARG
jgi:hypothetical protein